MENTPSSHVAANVRRLRKRSGWSLAQLSERLEEVGHPLSVPVLSKIELGDRGIDVNDLVALGRALDVEPPSLLEDPVIAMNDRVVQLLAEYRSAVAAQAEAWRAAADAVVAAGVRLREAVRDDEDARLVLEQELARQFPADSHWPGDLLDMIVGGDDGER